jgi:hypothetical protein
MSVKDAAGRKAELIVVPFPILPGTTHNVELMVDPEMSGIQSMDALTYPMTLKGSVEWEGGSYRVDGTVP